MASHEEKKHAPSVMQVGQWDAIDKDKVKDVTDEYKSYFEKGNEQNIEARKANYATVTNHYYDLVTDFYEYGWGQSFHFASRRKGQSFPDSLAEQERRLADKLNVVAGDKILDVGCGVGGPMREIARYTGASVVGLNNNAYQVKRLAVHNARAGLADTCSAVKGDFMHMPFDDNTFDGVYAVEATCHAPVRKDVYSEVYRVLKPGKYYAMYEWCMTDKYKKGDPLHEEIKHGVEVGDGLPPMYTMPETVKAMEEAGFEVVYAKDAVDNRPNMIPWYATLQGQYSLAGFRMTWLGRTLTHNLCRFMELVGFAPKGTVAASQILMEAADSLVASGVHEIFTPMFLVVGRKK